MIIPLLMDNKLLSVFEKGQIDYNNRGKLSLPTSVSAIKVSFKIFGNDKKIFVFHSLFFNMVYIQTMIDSIISSEII